MMRTDTNKPYSCPYLYTTMVRKIHTLGLVTELARPPNLRVKPRCQSAWQNLETHRVVVFLACHSR